MKNTGNNNPSEEGTVNEEMLEEQAYEISLALGEWSEDVSSQESMFYGEQ